MNLVLDWVESFLTDVLIVCIESNLNLFANKCFDSVEHIVVNFLRLKFELLLADFLLDIRNESYNLLDFFVTLEDCFEQCVVVNFICTSFNHYDFFHCTCNCKVEVSLFTLFKSWVEYDFAIDKTNADAADWTVPWNIGN